MTTEDYIYEANQALRTMFELLPEERTGSETADGSLAYGIKAICLSLHACANATRMQNSLLEQMLGAIRQLYRDEGD